MNLKLYSANKKDPIGTTNTTLNLLTLPKLSIATLTYYSKCLKFMTLKAFLNLFKIFVFVFNSISHIVFKLNCFAIAYV